MKTILLAAAVALSSLACSDSDRFTGPPCLATSWVVVQAGNGLVLARNCDGGHVAQVCAAEHPGAFVEVALAGPRYSIAYRSDGAAWVRHGNPAERVDCLRAEDFAPGDAISIEG